MAKTKETKVALKGEDPKKAPKASKTARKVPPHHEEVKVVSDSSSSDSESNSGSDSESELEKQKSTKKPNVSKAKKSEPNSPPVKDDSSEESSSDDDDSDSSSEGEAMKAIKADKKQSKSVKEKKKAPAVVSTNGKVSKSNETLTPSDDETSEDEASDEDMEDAPAQSVKVAAQVQEPVDPTRAVAPQPFNPPPGYKPLDTAKANSNTLSSLLSNPDSKQIWHITAPSSVPITQIQSVSLAAIQSQSSILTHKNTSYTLAEEKESKTTKKVLVPGKKGYEATELPVSKSLVLQQVITIPNLDSAVNGVGPKPHKEPRPQPKGLRMRYKPFGYGSGDPGTILGSDESEDEDVEMAEPVTFKAPKGVQSEKEKEKERKRKRDEKEAGAETTTPRTDKKRRKDKKSTVVEPEEDMQVLKGQEAAVAKIQESQVEGTLKEAPETEEEKARKKAEKKEKKSKSKEKKR